MRLCLALLLALATTSNTTGRPDRIEKGRNLLVDRNLHSHLSPYQTQDKPSRRHKSKLARDDRGERDTFVPIDERANYEYSQTVDGVEVNVNVNVNVEVNTGGSGSIPSPTTSPTTECLRWDISYVTEMKNQYFKYQYYGSKSSKSKSGKGSGKSGKGYYDDYYSGKSGKGKSEGKSGKSKAEKIMMKQVAVQKEVKTCIERRTPNPTIAPTMVQLITASPTESTPRPSEMVEIPQTRPTPIPTMINITPDPVGITYPPTDNVDTQAPSLVMVPIPTVEPVMASAFPTPSSDVTLPPIKTSPPVTKAPTLDITPLPTDPPIITPKPTLPAGATNAPVSPTEPPNTAEPATLPPQTGPLPTEPPQSETLPTLPPQTESIPTNPPQSGALPTLPPVANIGELSWDFESGVFPEPPWTTEGDGIWAIDQTNVADGVYSIKSPDLETGYVEGSGALVSNATLTLNDSFAGGLLKFQALASVQPPRDIFVLYVDGEEAAQLVNTQEFTEVVLELSEGAHTINFSYQFNPLQLPILPPSPLERLGAVWIDTVTIEDSSSSLPPQTAILPTLPPQSGAIPTAPPQSAGLPTLPPQSVVLPTLPPQTVAIPTLPPQTDVLPTLLPQSAPLPTLPPQTGVLPTLPPQTDVLPTLPPQTGLLPTLPPQTGSAPTNPPQTGLLPTLPPQTGELPTLPPQTGLLPTLPPQTGSVPTNPPTNPPQTGLLPTLPPQTGALPTLPPQTDVLPTLPPQTGTTLLPSVLSDGTLQPSILSNETITLQPTTSLQPTISTISSSSPSISTPTITFPPQTPGEGPTGSLYYEGFEDGTFPIAPWTTEGTVPWGIDTERVRTGSYSIRSGNLDLTDFATEHSNLTFITSSDWPDGTMIISALVGTQLPIDELTYYVDGVTRGKLTSNTEWQQLRISLPPGQHTILFSYVSNGFGLAELPPAEPGHIEAVFFDNVYYLPSGVTAAPTDLIDSPVAAPSSLPPQNGLSTSSPTLPAGNELLFDFESGVFPEPPWTTEGDGVWAIDQTNVADGVYSIKSPDFDTGYAGGTLNSNATLTLDDSFAGGVMTVKVYASVLPPRDILVIYIDNANSAQLVDTDGFTDVTLGLSPGPHIINFSYEYNPFNLPLEGLGPSPPERLGAAWVDSVTIKTLAEAPPGDSPLNPQEAPDDEKDEPTSSPSYYPTRPPSGSPTYYPSYLPTKNPGSDIFS